jgi:DNA-binding beta-propeller fold protein YncE
MRRHFRIVLASSVVLFSLSIFGASPGEMRRPIALDKIDGGDLYVLDAGGTVFRLREATAGLGIVESFELPGSHYPTDLISAKLFGQPTLFVTLNSKISNIVAQLSLDGKLQHSWIFTRALGGLDVDFNSHILYVASSERPPEVYQVTLQPSQYTDPVFVGEAVGASRLGPLVFDAAKKKLYLGDVEAGQIIEFDIATKRSRVISRSFSSPQALLVSADGGLLYVADSSRKRIYALDLQHLDVPPKPFPTIGGLKSPSGLARLDDGRIVVSDDSAERLFVLSKTGSLVSTFP